MKFTAQHLAAAATNGEGPFLEWLHRVHARGGDKLLRRFALTLLKLVEVPRAPVPAELLTALATAIEEPEVGRLELRPWLACDCWLWREIAKLLFEWGGAERSGARLARQVAIVTSVVLTDREPGSTLDEVRRRMPGLPDYDE